MNQLREALAGYIREKYGVELAIVLERPPKIEMGEAASPVCFELAKRLKKAPRLIAQEIANGLRRVKGIAKVEVAGGGYLNAYFDRATFWETLRQGAEQKADSQEWLSHKIIVEHTSINPNKAAHIGHVRNAVLGDTMARILRHAGSMVQIQNYIDNTGVQVADVVIGFLHMEQRTPVSVKMLRKSGAIQLATSGKMAGCWIMPWEEEVKEVKEETSEDEDENSQDKIIVRSNGTVTYVGKDIAYQLWKFGLLGKDFHYRKWPNAPERHAVWATTSGGNDPEAPHFGEAASSVYNVIDARQAYLQKVVAAGLRALGHVNAAEHSIHLSYEIVALTPQCAAEMGYELTPEEVKKPYVEVSGRKGFGVKADDLLDKLEAATVAEVQQRHAEMNEAEQKKTAHAIAVGALRFFLLKFTRNAIIAFDFKDALSFEGETGPYCQYAVVRIRGIRRKGKAAGATGVEGTKESVGQLLAGAEGNSLWELLVAAGSLGYAVGAAVSTPKPGVVGEYSV